MTYRITPEKDVPYPQSTEPEYASTLRENMQIAANTADVLKGLGAEIEELPDDQEQADSVFADFAKRAQQQYEEAINPQPEKKKRGRPRIHPIPATTPLLERPSVAQRIGVMLREYNNQLVADAAEMRVVVTNKLLDLASCGDPRVELKATEMLGKISDVGLFSEKTEITVTYNNVQDLDAAIKDKLRKMMRAYAVDVPSMDIDVDAEFGLTKKIEQIEASEPDLPAEPALPADEEPENGRTTD